MRCGVSWLPTILSDAGVRIEIISNSELLMDSTSLGVLKVRQVDDNPRGGGGGGYSDIFIHVYEGSGHLFGFKVLNCNTFEGG